jgi:hypothetical protein
MAGGDVDDQADDDRDEGSAGVPARTSSGTDLARGPIWR